MSKKRETIHMATVVGNAIADGEVKTVGTGTKLGIIRLAWNQYEGGDVGPGYITIQCWREASRICEFVRKGDRLTVLGQLIYRKYTDRDGNKRSSYTIDVSGPNTHVELPPKSWRDDPPEPEQSYETEIVDDEPDFF